MKKVILWLWILSGMILWWCAVLPAPAQKMGYVAVFNQTWASNWEQIDIYQWWKLVFSKAPIDGIWSFYKLIDNILFVDYWTAVGGRTIRLFDIEQKWKLIFESRYNGNLTTSGNILYFNFGFYPDPQWVKCSNYEQIKQMWWSVNYEQKRSYNFKTNTLKNESDIYCAYWE